MWPPSWLFAAAISRWASALDGLARNLLNDPQFAGIVRRDIDEGQHLNPTGRLEYFTTAYFHRPEQLLAELAGAGFTDSRLFGIEGPGWLLPDVAERMSNPLRRAVLLDIAERLEAEPSILSISAHLLAVAHRP